MSGNSFGTLFRITTFGESHGDAMGVVIDGCPAGLTFDLEFIQTQLNKRRPGQSSLTTQRKESDIPHIISGVFEGKTTGTPIAALFKNEDSRSKDYRELENKFRPSHADFTYEMKYGYRDHRGGGRSSARETVARVFAGAIAQLLLKNEGIIIQAYVSQVGTIKLIKTWENLNLHNTWKNSVHCPDEETAHAMEKHIELVREQGDTVGGIVTGVIQGCPAGLGEPVFDRLQADLAKAMLSINAVKGFEYGSGFSGVPMKGSEHNDPFVNLKEKIQTQKNHSGGIQGGISNGMPIYFNVGFKPVATIMKKQTTVDQQGETTEIEGKGRHDPCVVPRAVAIVEAMAALTVADHWLRNKCSMV